MSLRRLAAVAVALVCWQGKGWADAPSALVDLGRAMFFDVGLSEPRGTSCASCHDPTRAYSGDNGSRLGVPRGSRPGHFARRSSPSLLYLRYVPAFRFFQEGDDPRPAPFGGLFWDGRVDSVTDLARQPLLNPDEMNNPDGRTVAAKIARAPYAEAFRRTFGAALDDPAATLKAVGTAIDSFLTSPDMAPFSSKYDDVIRKKAHFTAQEDEGLRLFKDRKKGACKSCHAFNDRVADPASSLFTDFGYDAVAVPRNPRLPRGRGAGVDKGLCERRDKLAPSDDPMYCINFRTPSLRNVAVRGSYMHNGAFTRLRDVVAFYATRATNPKRWYKSGMPFDLPPEYRTHVNTVVPPYNRHEGDPPALDDREIDAIVAFLRTLTDARYATAVAR